MSLMFEVVAHPTASIFHEGRLYEGVIRPSALILHEGRFLAVRHKKEDFYCLPGGKRNRGENSDTALIREVEEETCLAIGGLELVQRLAGISQIDGQYLQFPLYNVGKFAGHLAANGEIAQYAWIDELNYPQIKVASIIGTRIIPGLIEGEWQRYVPQLRAA